MVMATGVLEEGTLSLKDKKDKGIMLARQAVGGSFGDGIEGKSR